VAAFGLICAANAEVVGVRGGNLYTVDTVNGARSNPRPIAILGSPAGIAFDGTDLFLLATTIPSSSLYRVNTLTGATTLVGSLGLEDVFEGDLAFDAPSGILYGINQAGAGGPKLFRINRATGAASGLVPIQNSASSDFSALAFDGVGRMWAVDTAQDTLVQLNPVTAQRIQTFPLGRDLGTVAGMTWDPTTGTMYLADGQPQTQQEGFYTVNLSNGALNLIAPLTGTDAGYSGLAYIPAPPGVAVFAAALATRRRRGPARHQGRNAKPESGN
jgi:hypothetical protein